MPEAQTENPFSTLQGHKQANLTTFRKSGEPVITPAWYVVLDGKLYVRTGADSGKVKRILNNPRIRLAPATVRGKRVGPESEARARILGSGEKELAETAMKLFRRKYKTAPIIDLLVRGHSGPFRRSYRPRREAELCRTPASPRVWQPAQKYADRTARHPFHRRSARIGVDSGP